MSEPIEDGIRRGRNAKYLLESEAFQDVIADLRAGTVNTWRTSNSAHTDLREAAFFQMQALDAIEAKLQAWMASAKFDADRLEKANQRTSRQA